MSNTIRGWKISRALLAPGDTTIPDPAEVILLSDYESIKQERDNAIADREHAAEMYLSEHKAKQLKPGDNPEKASTLLEEQVILAVIALAKMRRFCHINYNTKEVIWSDHE